MLSLNLIAVFIGHVHVLPSQKTISKSVIIITKPVFCQSISPF